MSPAPETEITAGHNHLPPSCQPFEVYNFVQTVGILVQMPNSLRFFLSTLALGFHFSIEITMQKWSHDDFQAQQQKK